MNNKSHEASKEDSKILYGLMLTIIFVSMGQSVYWQTMPIIGREFGFSEMEINTVVSISATMFIIFTPFWGRLSDKIGRKSVLLIGLTGYVLSNIIFLFSASIGLLGYITGFSLLFVLLVSRIINSAVGAASRPATGAYVADVTSLEERSSGMGKFGAANNIGTILGPILVGSIIGINVFNSKIEGFSLLTPLVVMSLLMIVAIVFVLLFLPNKKSTVSNAVENKRPTLNYNMKLLISIGVIIFTAFAIVQSVTAYYIQDRFSLSLDETARSTALLLGTMAFTAIIVQLTFVQRFKGPSLDLIKYSIPLFIASSLLILFSPSYIYIYSGMACMGLGMGLASPGYTASASLNADPDSQGAAVGLAMVAPGLGFALGPFLSGLLYSSSMDLPFLFILPLFISVYFISSKLEAPKPS